MVEIILMTLAVLAAAYFILRMVLNKLASVEQDGSCQGCNLCGCPDKTVQSAACKGQEPSYIQDNKRT